MNRTGFSAFAALLLAALSVCHAAAFSVDSKVLGEMQLQVPDSSVEKKYLGISGTGTFCLPQIQADLIIVEIFSMYCPICQAEAENVNKMHQIIEGDSGLKGKVKLIGIGTGNTPFEVDVFRKKYDIKFPLFPDDSFRIQKAASKPVRTPTFFAVERRDGQTISVRDVHVGAIPDVDKFLQEMTRKK